MYDCGIFSKKISDSLVTQCDPLGFMDRGRAWPRGVWPGGILNGMLYLREIFLSGVDRDNWTYAKKCRKRGSSLQDYY